MLNLFRPARLPVRVSTGLLIIRVVAGLAFMFHGWGKIQNPFGWMGENAPFPGILLALAAVAEFGGGFAWIVGFLTPLASFLLACTMAVATWQHAIVRGDPFVSAGGASYELAAAYLAVALLLLLTGPGAFALDRLVFRERKRPYESPGT